MKDMQDVRPVLIKQGKLRQALQTSMHVPFAMCPPYGSEEDVKALEESRRLYGPRVSESNKPGSQAPLAPPPKSAL